MAVYGYTKNYKLIKPQFDTDTWHDYEYDNLDTIDAVLSAIFASGDWQGFWKTNTHYDAGGVVIDRNTDTMYKIMVEHTTSEATFAEEFAANPTYYELWSPNNLAEDWAIKMDGMVSNTDYSSKAYAISSTLIDNGSAKEWAIGSGEVGDTGEYSAKKYATDAHDDYISMTTDVNVIAVGTNIANVNAVGQSISDVNTVASDISSVNTVAGISTDVTTVASIANAVSNVSGIESEVLDVSDNRTDISTVASNIGDVNTVAAIDSDVSTVADNDTNVTTVATNISDVNTAATNIAAIQAAPTAATNAAASATLAQDWATKMDGQVASTDYSSKYYAGQADTSASNAAVWAEGTDEQVQALGGVHSSKVWAEQSTNANTALTNSPYTTNRILEIPQDIKLELNNGTLTLKAGSKVYDGNNNSFSITSDITKSGLAGGDVQQLLLLKIDGTTLISVGVTDTNFAYNSSTGYVHSNTYGDYYLPIALTSHNTGTGVYTSIDQVFNGFGYIGSTVFALPGVKVQFPNGRNEDGTCINGYYTNDSVKTFSNISGTWCGEVWLGTTGLGISSSLKYIPEENRIKHTDGSYRNMCSLGYVFISSGKITSFTPCTVDSVANSNASNFSQAGRSYLSGLGYPSDRYIDLTLGASGSSYTAPANGYFLVYVYNSGNTFTYSRIRNMTTGFERINPSYGASSNISIVDYPAHKGEVVRIDYTAQNVNFFRFYYAEGEN